MGHLQARQNLPSVFSHGGVACQFDNSNNKFSRQFYRVKPVRDEQVFNDNYVLAAMSIFSYFSSLARCFFVHPDRQTDRQFFYFVNFYYDKSTFLKASML